LAYSSVVLLQDSRNLFSTHIFKLEFFQAGDIGEFLGWH